MAARTIALRKYFTREYSLFLASVWDESNRKDVRRWLPFGVQNELILCEGPESALSVWYSPREFDLFYKCVASSLQRDPRFIGRVERAFLKNWREILAIIGNPRRLDSASALSRYYRLLVRYWSPMSIAYSIPNIAVLPESVKKRALKLRAMTQEYAGKEDKAFLIAFKRLAPPRYRAFAAVVTRSEALDLIRDRASPKLIDALRQRRQKGFALLNGKVLPVAMLSQELRKRHLRLRIPTPAKQPLLIRGMAASAGRATGLVRILRSKREVHLLRRGEVLVTAMTTPDFVPAMKKAVAFVTDEGGITSHAAIIAREMKKPCIIGTKIATRVLKNGQRVLVDADRGVVTIRR